MSDVLQRLGKTFARFDERTQDSGHVSCGVEQPSGRRLFVKTAGDDAVSPGGWSKVDRIIALRRAATVQQEVEHSAFVPLHDVIEASDGVLVVYDWFPGELLRSPPERRADPAEAHNRFRRLPLDDMITALDAVIDLHVHLERAGWIAGDFYDGTLMYDFNARRVVVIDLESYHHGPFVNRVGRLPGSTRFMAPEEFEAGAQIDARTTVFNLARMVQIFLLSGHPLPHVSHVATSATAIEQNERPSSVAAFHDDWLAAIARTR